MSYARKNSRKQLLEALQPFQACVSPNDDRRLDSHVEVMDMSAAPSAAQVSNDLSDATETDKAQHGFDKQSLTEVPTATAEPEPVPLPTMQSVPQPRQSDAEEQIFGMNERAGSHEGKGVSFAFQDFLERRHEFDLHELLGQLGHQPELRPDQLNIMQQVCYVPNQYTDHTACM